MKFNCEVSISLPKLKVVELWKDEKNLVHWQDDFVGIDLISGEKATVGSQYLIRYKKLELKETLLEYNMPDSMLGLYEHKMMSNTMKNTFSVINENQTLWKAEIEYTQIKGFMKIISKLFPSLFKKQTQKWLNQFKQFAESHK